MVYVSMICDEIEYTFDSMGCLVMACVVSGVSSLLSLVIPEFSHANPSAHSVVQHSRVDQSVINIYFYELGCVLLCSLRAILAAKKGGLVASGRGLQGVGGERRAISLSPTVCRFLFVGAVLSSLRW